MELTLSILTVLYSALRFNAAEIVMAIIRKAIRLIFAVTSIFILPVAGLYSLKKRRRCPEISNKILLLSATELSRKIRRRELSSEEVISAYVTRCKEVNNVLNAIVESCFDEALRRAREIDDFLRSTNKTEEELARDTPLLGLPITVKGSIAVKGLNYSVGLKEKKDDKALEDAETVKRARKAGAIPLLVSNTPELCMWWDTYNNLTGITWNPYDTRRTVGGSSGGEAALVGSAASLLSLSSDIGGSIRVPAMFCGIFGHKPTPGWVSVVGHKPDCLHRDLWISLFTQGTMVRYAEDIPLILKVVSEVSASVHRLDEKISMRSIKFFYMEDDCGSGVTTSVNDEIKFAIHRLAQYIEITHGVKVQKANIKDMKFSFELSSTALLKLNDFHAIYTKNDNVQEWNSVMVEVVKYLCLMSPYTFPNICYGVVKKVFDTLPESFHKRMSDKLVSLKKQFEELLGDNGVLIYPCFVSAANYPYEMFYKMANVSYMMIFNALGFPVTQCPTGLNSKGLPIGLQIIANPGCDRLTIAVAKEVEKAFGGWQEPWRSSKIEGKYENGDLLQS